MKVRIYATEKVIYSQEVEISEDQFKILKDKLEDGSSYCNPILVEKIMDYVDRSDVYDSEDAEVEEFEKVEE